MKMHDTTILVRNSKLLSNSRQEPHIKHDHESKLQHMGR